MRQETHMILTNEEYERVATEIAVNRGTEELITLCHRYADGTATIFVGTLVTQDQILDFKFGNRDRKVFNRVYPFNADPFSCSSDGEVKIIFVDDENPKDVL